MDKAKTPIGWRILKWFITLLTLLYAAQSYILYWLQSDVKYADRIQPFYLLNRLLGYSDTLTFLLDIAIAIALCVGLHVLIDKHCESRANREKDAARLREEAARFDKTAQRMTGATLSQREDPKLTPIMEWCAAATKQVPKVRHGAVYTELMGHLLDHRDAMVENGYSVDAAERAAIQAMGDPEVTAQQLRKSEHTLSGLLKQLRYMLFGRGWALLYSGDDEQRCSELHHILSEVGIECRVGQYTGQSRYSYMQVASMGGAVRGNRSGIRNPSVIGIASVTSSGVTVPLIHSITIRKRDLPAAKRLIR